MKIGQIVTLDFKNQNVSNVYFVKKIDETDNTALLYHPLYPECYLLKNIDELNLASAKLKDSTEKCLDYVASKVELLDYNTKSDLEALCLYFIVKRQLTPKQKSTLSKMCGFLASIHFNNDISETISFINHNNAVLDEFNRMWYNNFKKLFNGKQLITSNKQRSSIFNIAGFILAELHIPKINK